MGPLNKLLIWPLYSLRVSIKRAPQNPKWFHLGFTVEGLGFRVEGGVGGYCTPT